MSRLTRTIPDKMTEGTETKISITLTFTGRDELTPQQIWEFIDDAIQDRQVEFNGDDYYVTVEKTK